MLSSRGKRQESPLLRQDYIAPTRNALWTSDHGWYMEERMEDTSLLRGLMMKLATWFTFNSVVRTSFSPEEPYTVGFQA